MGSVAAHATFGLHRGVLVDKRPARLRVALGADRILVCGRLQVVIPECSVNVMAIAALHQLFIHLVVEGHIERRLHVRVALEAEVRLRSLQQRLFLAGVNVVAADAAYVGLGVRRPVEVGMRSRVAPKALLIHFLGRSLGGIEDLGDIAAALHVRSARTMAAFAVHAGCAMLCRKLGVRIAFKLLGYLVMAGGADFAADVCTWCGVLGRRFSCFHLSRGLLRLRSK